MACTYLKDGDLAKRLHFHESFGFVLTLGLPVDVNQLEGNFPLNENSCYTWSAGRGGEAVEFQDHACDARVVRWGGRRCFQRLCGGVLLSFSGVGLSSVRCIRH